MRSKDREADGPCEAHPNLRGLCAAIYLASFVLVSGCFPGGAVEHQVAEKLAETVNRRLCGEDYRKDTCGEERAYFDTAAGKAVINVYGVKNKGQIDEIVNLVAEVRKSAAPGIDVEVVFFDSRITKRVIQKREIEN